MCIRDSTYMGFVWLKSAHSTMAAIRQFGPALRSSGVRVSWNIFVASMGAVVRCIILLSPLMLHLLNGYRQFCSHNLELSPAWCHHSFPNIYSYCQQTFWNVGFLNYFTLAQLPNFALALPMVLLVLSLARNYWMRDPLRFCSGGLLASDKKGTRNKSDPNKGFGATGCAPYVCHCFGLLVISLPVIHIQVIGRLLISSPAVYWYAAHLFGSKSWHQTGILVWFLGYIAVGVILHSNFLPWT
eukprot:TRINITY_DN39487_c0_g1_i1.p1 TRINITY_DN39487_c0_g1~~TRINITY_DN39487_c0_g1_i1.p1  ORF type:complete len:242 (+),score=41.16 TRINITY_DN39487_c0_g1_i1:89-814(+)